MGRRAGPLVRREGLAGARGEGGPRGARGARGCQAHGSPPPAGNKAPEQVTTHTARPRGRARPAACIWTQGAVWSTHARRREEAAARLDASVVVAQLRGIAAPAGLTVEEILAPSHPALAPCCVRAVRLGGLVKVVSEQTELKCKQGWSSGIWK